MFSIIPGIVGLCDESQFHEKDLFYGEGASFRDKGIGQYR